MTTAVYDSPEVPQYGATELKEYIRKSTARGFIATVSLLLLLFLIWFAVQKITAEDESKRVVAPRVKISLSDLPPPPQAADVPPVPPPPQVTQVQAASGPASRAGNPVPVPDEMIAPDIKEFASTNEISRASSIGGEGQDFGGTFDTDGAGTVQLDIAAREETPDPDEFIPVEKEPYVDLADLQKKVVYPDMAIRAKLEGKVIIRVLVGKNGKPKDTRIDQSDNKLFNDAATKAVMASTFTPAIQNKQPIDCWVSIPVTFKLR